MTTTTGAAETLHHLYSTSSSELNFFNLSGSITVSDDTTITPIELLAGSLFNYSNFPNQVQEIGDGSTFPLPVHALEQPKETEKNQKRERLKDRGVRIAQTQAMIRKETKLAKENASKRLRGNWGKLTEEEKSCMWLELENKMKAAKEQLENFERETDRLQKKTKRLCEKIEKERVPCKKDELKTELGEAKEAQNEAKDSLVKARINTARVAGIEKAMKEHCKDTREKNMTTNAEETEISHHQYSTSSCVLTFPSLHDTTGLDDTTIMPTSQLAGGWFHSDPFLNQVWELGGPSTFPLPVHALELKETEKNQKQERLKDRVVRIAQTQSTMHKETKRAKENASKRLRGNWGKLTEEEKSCMWLELENKMKAAKEQREKFERETDRLQKKTKRLCEKIEKERIPCKKDELKTELGEAKEAQNEAKDSLIKARINTARVAGIEKAMKEHCKDTREKNMTTNAEETEISHHQYSTSSCVLTFPSLHDSTLDDTTTTPTVQLAGSLFNYSNFPNQVWELGDPASFSLPVHPSPPLKGTEKDQERVKDRSARAAQTHSMMCKETKLAKENELKRLGDSWRNLTEEEKQWVLDESVSNVKEANEQNEKCKEKAYRLSTAVSRLCERIEKAVIPDEQDELMAKLGEEKEALNEARSSLVTAQINKAKAVGVEQARKEMLMSDRTIVKDLRETGEVLPLKKRKADAGDDNTYGCKRRKSIPGTSKELEELLEESDDIATLFLSVEEENLFSPEELEAFLPEKQKEFFSTTLPWED